jgi:hypothetical protein
MKNIQAQYQDLLEGKMSKANFMRNVRMQFPQYVSSVSSFDDSVKILKGKRILSEAKNPIGAYGYDPSAENVMQPGIDQLNYYQVYHGIQYELAKMPEITDEAYIKARKKVVDNILKNPDAYKELQIANFKAVKEMDEDLKMKEVKENNKTDKPNEMKVVKKDAKGNTEDTLEKKEKKKSKTGKIPVMTQAPKGKLKAFATPGKEKVMALKEHILDELTIPNTMRENIGKGDRVKKKQDDSKKGEVTDFDGDTVTVKWDDGGVEHVQMNVLTKRDVDVPTHPKITTAVGWNNETQVTEDPVGQQAAGDPEAEAGLRSTLIKKEDMKSKIQKIKERLLGAIKKEGFAITTKGGKALSAGRNKAQGFTTARNLEKSTGSQLKVVDTDTGDEREV